MMSEFAVKFERFRSRLRTLLLGPQLLAFMPAITLAGFWLGGETSLILIALLLPAAFALAGLYTVPAAAAADPATGLMLRNAVVGVADRFLTENPRSPEACAALVIGLDDFAELNQRLEPRAVDLVLGICADRIVGAVRTHDAVARLEGPRFAVALGAGTRADLDSLIQISARIQHEIQEPLIVDGARIFVTASIGFCAAAAAPVRSGEALLSAAEHAQGEAKLHGGGAVRAFAPDMQKRAQTKVVLHDELPQALERDEIAPWFQPQIDARTSAVTGVEVLARWIHPERGIIPPAEFLKAAESLGLMERLGEVMLYRSLGALRTWDTAGIVVPSISINFSSDELRNPKLVEKVCWELDRFGITPERLTVEVLETVIADVGNDTIIRNLRAFADLGCGIDLDDFGTGHASITNIRRFCVNRIKIDRSFVTQLDTDPEQKTIVAAIVTMAERLGLKTLAEGVETPGEHAALKALGCDYLQGFGIARPMPFADVESWLVGFRKRTATSPEDVPGFSPAPAPTASERPGKTA